ncbi:MAG: S1 family peptidase [Thermodesulfobacteriota bacterium]
MPQNVYQTYRGGCMLLFSLEGQEVVFLGTAFVIHSGGYLITVAHTLYRHDNLMVAPYYTDSEFFPLSYEKASPIPVHVAQVHMSRDLALLKFKEDMGLQVPAHLIGRSEETLIGSSVACLGYGFGHYQLHNLVLQQAVICSKVQSENETRLLLFDTMVHNGSRGAPLVNLSDNRVVGVVSGRFDPSDMAKDITREREYFDTNISFAVDISHVVDLIADEGLKPE